MAKMYTLDDKLLASSPEIRIGDKVYPVDNRVKTVKKVMKMYEKGAGVWRKRFKDKFAGSFMGSVSGAR